MKAKVLEIRDRATFIPALAVDMNSDYPNQTYLLKRSGYCYNKQPCVLLTKLSGGGEAQIYPQAWDGRTWPVAHEYITANWEQLKDGDVIDVEFILGETDKIKTSEACE